jgi:hypothetical protein
LSQLILPEERRVAASDPAPQIDIREVKRHLSAAFRGEAS